jgi:NitT/TauT family transport system substrate-binding protein
MLSRCGIFCLVLAVAFLGGCDGKADRRALPPAGPVKVVLQLDDVPRAELAGFFQALAKGFYRRAGLDVTIASGAPGLAAGVAVAEGRAEFGVSRSDDVLLGASLGRPLQMIAAVRQHDPRVLIVRAKSPVKKLADLNGRTVLAAEEQAWIAFWQKRLRIKFSLKAPTPAMGAFLAAEDAIQEGYATSDVFDARRRGADVRAVALSDAQYDAYHAIFCRRDYAEQNPAVARAFVAASLLGWRDFLENDPTPGGDLLMQRNPALTPELLEYARGEMILGQLVAGDPGKGEYPGALSFDRLGRELDLLLEVGAMASPVSLPAVATREYLPPVGL